MSEAIEKVNHFNELSKIDVSKHVEKKGNGKFSASYLSWASAWGLLKARDPEADFSYIKHKDVIDGVEFEVPYLRTPFGYIVEVEVTAYGKSYRELLPVMDHKFQAIKNPTIRDITDAQKRCLAKAIALHGLGINLYVGEDFPVDFNNQEPTVIAASEIKDDFKGMTQQQRSIIGEKSTELASLITDSADQEVIKAERNSILAKYKIGKETTYEKSEKIIQHLDEQLKKMHNERMEGAGDLDI